MRLVYQGYDVKLEPDYPGVRATITAPRVPLVPGEKYVADYYRITSVRRLTARAAYRAAVRKIDKMVESKRRQELRRQAIEQVNAESQRDIEELARELGVANG